MFAEGGDELGGEGDGSVVFEEKREAFAKLDDESGLDPDRELDLDEADVSAGDATSMCGMGLGHAREISRSSTNG